MAKLTLTFAYDGWSFHVLLHVHQTVYYECPFRGLQACQSVYYDFSVSMHSYCLHVRARMSNRLLRAAFSDLSYCWIAKFRSVGVITLGSLRSNNLNRLLWVAISVSMPSLHVRVNMLITMSAHFEGCCMCELPFTIGGYFSKSAKFLPACASQHVKPITTGVHFGACFCMCKLYKSFRKKLGCR